MPRSATWSLAHAKAFFVDFGFLRKLNNNNFHRISPWAFRSGQPMPPELKRYVARHGIRTVVGLRGTKGARRYTELVERTCDELGVAFRNLKLASHKPPSPSRLHAARELLEEIEYPALFHCKSGADRAGLFSALYLHWMEGVPLEETRQLRFWPYGHIRNARTGVLDQFIDAYVSYSRQEPIDLTTWIDEVYRPEALNEPAPDGFRSWLVDRVLKRE